MRELQKLELLETGPATPNVKKLPDHYKVVLYYIYDFMQEIYSVSPALRAREGA